MWAIVRRSVKIIVISTSAAKGGGAQCFWWRYARVRHLGPFSGCGHIFKVSGQQFQRNTGICISYS